MDIPDENSNFVSALEIPEEYIEDVKPTIYSNLINSSKVDAGTLDNVYENHEMNSLMLGELPVSSSGTTKEDIVGMSSKVYCHEVDLSEFVDDQPDIFEKDSQGDDNEIWSEIKTLSVEYKIDDISLPVQDIDGILHEKDVQSSDFVEMSCQEALMSDNKKDDGHLIVEETLITYLKEAEVEKILVSDTNEPLSNILGHYLNPDSFSNELDLSSLILESEITIETTDSCLDMTKESINKEAANDVQDVERVTVESTNMETLVEELQTERAEQDFVADSDERGIVKELDKVLMKEFDDGKAEGGKESVEFQTEETIEATHSNISGNADQAIHASLEPDDKCDDLKIVEDEEKCLVHKTSEDGLLQEEVKSDASLAEDFLVVITDKPSLEESISDNSVQNSEVILHADLQREVIQEESVAYHIEKEDFEIDVNLNESPLINEEEFVPCKEIPTELLQDDNKHEDQLIIDSTIETPKPSEGLIENKDLVEEEKASHGTFDSTSVEEAVKEIDKLIITSDDQGGFVTDSDKNEDKSLTDILTNKMFLQSEELRFNSVNSNVEEVVECKEADNHQTSDVPQQIDMERKQVETPQDLKMSQKAFEEIIKKDLTTENDLPTCKTFLPEVPGTTGVDEKLDTVDAVQQTSPDEECFEEAPLKDHKMILISTTPEVIKDSVNLLDSESNVSNDELLMEEHDLASKGKSSVQPVASETSGNDLIERESIEEGEQNIKWMPAMNIEAIMNSETMEPESKLVGENPETEVREMPGLELPESVNDALGEEPKSEEPIVEIEGKMQEFSSIIRDTIETANMQKEEITTLISNEIQDQLLVMEKSDVPLTVDSQPIESETYKDIKAIDSIEEGLDKSKESSISASSVTDGEEKFVDVECAVETNLTPFDNKEESNTNDATLGDGNATEFCVQGTDMEQSDEGQNISEIKNASMQDKLDLGDDAGAETGYDSKDTLVTTCYAKDEIEFTMYMEVTKEIEYLQTSCSEIIITDADELDGKLECVCQEIEITISDAMDDDEKQGRNGEEFSTDTGKESELEKLVVTTDNVSSDNVVNENLGNVETLERSEEAKIKPSVEEINEIQKVAKEEKENLRTCEAEEETLLNERQEDLIKSHDEAEAPTGKVDNEFVVKTTEPQIPQMLYEDAPEAESSKDELNCENILLSSQFKEADSEERTAPDRRSEEVNSQEQTSKVEQILEVQENPSTGDDANENENEKTKEKIELLPSPVRKSNEDEFESTKASGEVVSKRLPLSESKENEVILENTFNLRDETTFEKDYVKENVLDNDIKIVEIFTKAEIAFENENNFETVANIPQSSPIEKAEEFFETKIGEDATEKIINSEEPISFPANDGKELNGLRKIKSDPDTIEVDKQEVVLQERIDGANTLHDDDDDVDIKGVTKDLSPSEDVPNLVSEESDEGKAVSKSEKMVCDQTLPPIEFEVTKFDEIQINRDIDPEIKQVAQSDEDKEGLISEKALDYQTKDPHIDNTSYDNSQVRMETSASEEASSSKEKLMGPEVVGKENKCARKQLEECKITELIETAVDSIITEVISTIETNLVALEGGKVAQALHPEPENTNAVDKTEEQVIDHDEGDEKEFSPDKHTDMKNWQKNEEIIQSLSGEKALIEETKSFEKLVKSNEIEIASIKLSGENATSTTEEVAQELSQHEITDEGYSYLNKLISDVLDGVIEEIINMEDFAFKMAENSTESDIDNKAKEFGYNGLKNIPSISEEITQNDTQNYALELASQVLREATDELLRFVKFAKHKDEKLRNEGEQTITSENCLTAEVGTPKVEILQSETEEGDKETQQLTPSIDIEKGENQSIVITSEAPNKETSGEFGKMVIDATVDEHNVETIPNISSNILNGGEKHEANELIEQVNNSISGTDEQTSPEKGGEEPSNLGADLESEKTRNLKEDKQESTKMIESTEEISKEKQNIADESHVLIKEDEYSTFEKISSNITVDEKIKLDATEQDLRHKSVDIKDGQENEIIICQATTDDMREGHEIVKTLPYETQNGTLTDVNSESDETRIIMDPDKSPTQETKSENAKSQPSLAIASPSATEQEVSSSENIELNVMTETESKPLESQRVEPDVELLTKSTGETFAEVLYSGGDSGLNVRGEAPKIILLENVDEDVKNVVQSYALEEALTSSDYYESVENELVIQGVSGEIIEKFLDEVIKNETENKIHFKDVKSLDDEQLTMHDQSKKVILNEAPEAFKETKSTSVIDVQKTTCEENDTQSPIKESHILKGVEEVLANEIEIVGSDQDPNILLFDKTKTFEIKLDLAEKDDSEQQKIEDDEESNAEERQTLSLEKNKNFPNTSPLVSKYDNENIMKEEGENNKDQEQAEGIDVKHDDVNKDEVALESESLSDLKVEVLNEEENINAIDNAKVDTNHLEENKFVEPCISEETESSADEEKSVKDKEQAAKDEERMSSVIVQREHFNGEEVTLESQKAVVPDHVLTISSREIISEVLISDTALDMDNSGNDPDKMIKTLIDIDEAKVEIDVKNEVLASSDCYEPVEKQIICEPPPELDDKEDDVAIESDAFSYVKVEVTNPEEVEVVHVKPSEGNTEETKLVEPSISEEDEGLVEKGEFEQVQASVGEEAVDKKLSFDITQQEQVLLEEETVPEAETNDVHSNIMKVSDNIVDEQKLNSLGSKESTISEQLHEPTSITDYRDQELLEELNITSEEVKPSEDKFTITELDHVIEETETQISGDVYSTVDEVEVVDGHPLDERSQTITSTTIDSNLSVTTNTGQITEFEFKPSDKQAITSQEEGQLLSVVPQESSCEISICKLDAVVVKEELLSPVEIGCLPNETNLNGLEFVTGTHSENKSLIEINNTDEEPAIVSTDTSAEDDNLKDLKHVSLPIENEDKETTVESSTVNKEESVDQQINIDTASISLEGDKETSAKTIYVEAPEMNEQVLESVGVVETAEYLMEKFDEMKEAIIDQVGSGSPDGNIETPSSSIELCSDVKQERKSIEIDQKPDNVIFTDEPLLSSDQKELKPSTISSDEKPIDVSEHISTEKQITKGNVELEVSSSEAKDSDVAEEAALASLLNKSLSDQIPTKDSEEMKSNMDGIHVISAEEKSSSCECVEHKEDEENIVEQTQQAQEANPEDSLTLEQQAKVLDETKDTTSNKLELVSEDGQLANIRGRQADPEEDKEEITFKDQSNDEDKSNETFESSVKDIGDISEESIVSEQSESEAPALVTTKLTREGIEKNAADHRLISEDKMDDSKPDEEKASLITADKISPTEDESLELEFVPEVTLEVSALEDKSSFDTKEGLVPSEEEKKELAKDARQSEDENTVKQSDDFESNNKVQQMQPSEETDQNKETSSHERSSDDEEMERTKDMKADHEEEENQIEEKLQISEGLLQGETIGTEKVPKDVELKMVSSEEVIVSQDVLMTSTSADKQTISLEMPHSHSEINEPSPTTEKLDNVDIPDVMPEVIDNSKEFTSDLVKDDKQQIKEEFENLGSANATALIGQGEQGDLLESVASDINENTSTNSELSEVTMTVIHSVQQENQSEEKIELEDTNPGIGKINEDLNEARTVKMSIADCQQTVIEATQMVCASEDVRLEKLVSLIGSPDKVQIGLDIENVQELRRDEVPAQQSNKSVEKQIEQDLELQSIKIEIVPETLQSEEAKEGLSLCGDTCEEASERKINLDGYKEITNDSVEFRESDTPKELQVCPSVQINEISTTTSQDEKPIHVVKLTSEESKSGTFQDRNSADMKGECHADENLFSENSIKEVIADLEFVPDTVAEISTSLINSMIIEVNEPERDIPNPQPDNLFEEHEEVDMQQASSDERFLESSPEVLVMENKAEISASVHNEIPSIETNPTLNDGLKFKEEESQGQRKESQFVEVSLTDETKWDAFQQENLVLENVTIDIKGSVKEESDRKETETQKILPVQESEKLLETNNKNEDEKNIISSEGTDEKTTENIDSFVEINQVIEFKQTTDENDQDKSLSENRENLKISQPKSEHENVTIISDDICKTQEVRLEKTYRALSPEEEQQTVVPQIKLNLEDELIKLGIEEMDSSSLFLNSVDENRRQLVKLPNEQRSPDVQLLKTADEITWTNGKSCTGSFYSNLQQNRDKYMPK